MGGDRLRSGRRDRLPVLLVGVMLLLSVTPPSPNSPSSTASPAGCRTAFVTRSSFTGKVKVCFSVVFPAASVFVEMS